VPQFLSQDRVLDGGEAMTALMGKDLLKEFSSQFPFFHHLGTFPSAETLPAALLFHFFGASEVSFRAAMLLVWLLGWIFFVLGQTRFNGVRAGLISGALLVFFPMWIPWSMTANRQTGAFLLTAILFWLAGKPPSKFWIRLLWAVGLGVGAGFLATLNALWSVSFAVFWLVLIWASERRVVWMAALFGGLVTVAILMSVSGAERSAISPVDIVQNSDIAFSLTQFPKRLFVALTGFFEEGLPLKAGPFTTVSAAFWLGAAALFLTRCFPVRREPNRPNFLAGCAMAIFCVAGFTFLVTPSLFAYGQMAALSPYLVLGVGASASRMCEKQNGVMVICLFLLAVGVAGIGNAIEAASDPRFTASAPGTLSTREARDRLIRELTANDIRYVFSLDPMLRWNLIFDSNEKIIARWLTAKDPFPRYARDVDRSLFLRKSYALVGLAFQEEAIRKAAQLNKIEMPTVHRIDNRYIWVNQPEQIMLIAFEFEPSRLEDLDLPADLINIIRNGQSRRQSVATGGQPLDQQALERMVKQHRF